MIARLPAAATLLLLGACAAVGPDYVAPALDELAALDSFPSAAREPAALEPGEPAAQWWRALGDPALDALVERAVSANYDLRVASANVAAAAAARSAIGTRRQPTVDLNGVVQERRQSSAQVVVANAADRFPTTTSGSVSADLAWEIDLFGRVRRSIEAADADLEAASALRADVIVAVLARVARAYVDLRGAQVRLAVAERNVAVQRQTLELVELLQREGAASQLDVARARTQLLTSEATMPSLRSAAVAAQNRLAALTAQAPGSLDPRLTAAADLPALPALVAVGDPAALLRRRPDIRAAERALAATAARIGVATADLFPTVSLGGQVGVGAAPLSNLDEAGAPFFGLGPRLTWNLFNREAIHARIRQADAGAAASLARYRQVVTIALEEVDSAVNAYTNELERRARLAAARDASVEASRLARLRYREGVEDFLTVLDAERRLLEIEDQLARSRIAVAQNLVDIHRALGGGWEAVTPPAHTPYVPR